MLKVYIIISCIVTILELATNLRFLSKNVRAYKNNIKAKQSVPERILKEIKTILKCWIPGVQLILGIVCIRFLTASEYDFIKTIDKCYKKAKLEQEEIEKIINKNEK